jgi:hypothetical protein
MNTMSQAEVGEAGRPVATLPALREQYLAADFSWYGLDEGWEGRRWLSAICPGATGPEHGTLGHGDEPSRRPGEPEPRRFVQVITVPKRPRRIAHDGTGHLEATTCATVASLAGVGLLADSWPWRLDHELRQEWMGQQTNLAWELADDLDGEGWRDLAIPVDAIPARFRYRESEYGWVLVGETREAYVGMYGRGVAAYDLGLARLGDLDAYAAPRG